MNVEIEIPVDPLPKWVSKRKQILFLCPLTLVFLETIFTLYILIEEVLTLSFNVKFFSYCITYTFAADLLGLDI